MMGKSNDLKTHRAGLLVRIFAWVRGGRVVWLLDYKGRESVSIAMKGAFGEVYCHAYWFTHVGHCILLDDGTVSEKSDSFYIRQWKFA